MALEGIGKFLGSFYTGYNQPYIEQRQKAELDTLMQLEALKARQADEALQRVTNLEQQKQQAINPQTPLRLQEFGRPEELQLYQAYDKAGIDLKAIAEAETARLAADAFAQAIPNVTSDTGLINIGLGKEYKPGVYRENETKADDAELRLRTISNLLNDPNIDPLISSDIAQNKSVFDTREVAIQGKDGKTRHGFASLTPSGEYVGATVKDKQGESLVIPPESLSKSSPEMVKANEMVEYGFADSVKEAMNIIYSSKEASPDKFWAELTKNKSINRYGGSVKPFNMLKDSLTVWKYAKHGEALPIDLTKDSQFGDLSKPQQNEIYQLIDDIQSNVRQPAPAMAMAMAKQGGTSGMPNRPFNPMPGFSANPQQPPSVSQMTGAMPAPQLQQQPNPIPQQPLPELQPLTPVAIHTAWTEIQKGTKPEEVQKALMGEGFDLSPESVNMTAIDAVNSGVPADVLQQYLKAIGIEWHP